MKLTLKPGKIVVKNPIGEWEGEKFKRYDGSYVTEEFVVSKGKTYYFKMRVYYILNRKMEYGNWSVTKKVKIKK